MQDDLISSLKEALQVSPDNVPLRLTLAEAFLQNDNALEAETQFKIILEKQPTNLQAKTGLAKVYFALEKYSTVIVILEEVIEQKANDVGLLVLLSRASLRNDEIAKAQQYYQRALQLNPELNDSELDEGLRVQSAAQHAADEILG
jgi:transitional endoplasmic reticulum ATPase